LTDCAPFRGCFLIDVKTSLVVKKFSGNSTSSYQLDSSNKIGYSIRCDAGTKFGSTDYITFFYDNKNHSEYAVPRYMNGTSSGSINPVPYIGTCGVKTFRIEGHVASTLCFKKKYIINATCGTYTYAPAAPIKSPVAAPVKASTRSPVVPVPAPSKESTNVPVMAPVSPTRPTPIKDLFKILMEKLLFWRK
jgi:hypothetical protein